MKKTHVLSKDLFPVIKETLANKQIVSLKVSGSSMRPFLIHQLSTVKILQSETYKKYDVVLYENPNKQMVLHRIIKIKDYFLICGDALKANEIIEPSKIYGKVIQISHGNKDVNIYATSYKLRVRLWVYLKPFRRILLKLLRK
jgi:signal peptidase I